MFIYPKKPQKTELDHLLDYVLLRNPEGLKAVLSKNGYPISNDYDDLVQKSNMLITTDPLGLEKILVVHPDLNVILELVEDDENEAIAPKAERDDNSFFEKLVEKMDGKKEPAPKASQEQDKLSLYEAHKQDFVFGGVLVLLLLSLFIIGKMN